MAQWHNGQSKTDMIETYIILTGRYDNHVPPALQLSAEGNSCGNVLKLTVNRTRHIKSTTGENISLRTELSVYRIVFLIISSLLLHSTNS